MLQTDNKPLTWLRTFREKNGRLTRWSLTLQPYTFEMQHREGKDNANTDALSRLPENENNRPCLALEKEGRNVMDDE